MPAISGGVPSRAERIEWMLSDALAGVQILVVDNCARRWQVFHETYTVCTGMVLEGPSVEWRYRGKVHQLHSADGLMLMEPGEVHANTKVTPRASFRVLMIQPAVVEAVAAELGFRGSRPHFKVAQTCDHHLHGLFVALHASLERASTMLERQSRFVACLRGMLVQCAESHPITRPAGHAVIRRAREFLQEHVADAITLEQLVAAAGAVSRFQLVRTFTAEAGVPPHAFQIGLRIVRARALLADGVPPARVSAELGFADQSHFGRHFRYIVGVNPAMFAKATAARHRARTF